MLPGTRRALSAVPQPRTGVPPAPRPPQLGVTRLFSLATEILSHCGLNCIFLMTSDGKHLFVCLVLSHSLFGGVCSNVLSIFSQVVPSDEFKSEKEKGREGVGVKGKCGACVSIQPQCSILRAGLREPWSPFQCSSGDTGYTDSMLGPPHARGAILRASHA